LRPRHFAEAAKEEKTTMSKYDPDELDALMTRCIDLLGRDVFNRIVDAPPRWSGFVHGLEAAIKANDGSPTKVTDTQIEWALEVALEIWPFEAEAVANHVYKGAAS
jgi:hypothetical protein